MIVFFSSRHHHFHIPYYSHRIVLIISHFLFSPKQLASTGSFHPISRCCRNPSCHSSQPWNINHQIELEMVRLAESENEPSQFCSPEQKQHFQKNKLNILFLTIFRAFRPKNLYICYSYSHGRLLKGKFISERRIL